MPTANKFQDFSEQQTLAIHDWDTHVFKVALTNSAPVATNTVLANITQISGTNGYTTGGTAASISSSAQTAGVYKLVLGDVTFTASGGSIGPFRYAVLYNDSATSDELIGYSDYGTNITITNGASFTVDHHATNGVLTIT